MKENLEIVFFYEGVDRSARIYFSEINTEGHILTEPLQAHINDAIGRKLHELSLHNVVTPLGAGEQVNVTNVQLYVIGVPNVSFQNYQELTVTVKKDITLTDLM